MEKQREIDIDSQTDRALLDIEIRIQSSTVWKRSGSLYLSNTHMCTHADFPKHWFYLMVQFNPSFIHMTVEVQPYQSMALLFLKVCIIANMLMVFYLIIFRPFCILPVKMKKPVTNLTNHGYKFSQKFSPFKSQLHRILC